MALVPGASCRVQVKHGRVTRNWSSCIPFQKFTDLLCLIASTEMNTNMAVRRLYRTSQQALRHHHTPFRIIQPQLVAQRNLCCRSAHRHSLPKRVPQGVIVNQLRRESTEATYKPLTDRSKASHEHGAPQSEEIAERKAQEPAYELVSFHPIFNPSVYIC